MNRIEQAELVWSALNGQAISVHRVMEVFSGLNEEDFLRYAHVLPDDIDGLLALYDPVFILQLKEAWRPKFKPTVSLDEPQALKFLLQLSSEAQYLDGLFKDFNLAGVTNCCKGDLSDADICRPAGAMRGWHLTFTTQGQGDYNCVSDRFISKKGDLVLLSPDALVDYRRHVGCDQWQHYWLYIQQNPRFNRWLNWPEIGPHVYQLKLPGDHYSDTLELFKKAVGLAGSGDLMSQSLLANTIEEILIRGVVNQRSSESTEDGERVDVAKDYINRSLFERFTIYDVAEQVGLSKTRLSSVFKRVTGYSVFQWRDERRIAKASRLLLETDLSIGEIAERLGYSDPLYFSRSFRKVAACSPSQFRASR